MLINHPGAYRLSADASLVQLDAALEIFLRAQVSSNKSCGIFGLLPILNSKNA